MKKRLLAMLLVLMLVVSLLPVGALADGNIWDGDGTFSYHITDSSLNAMVAKYNKGPDSDVDSVSITFKEPYTSGGQRTFVFRYGYTIDLSNKSDAVQPDDIDYLTITLENGNQLLVPGTALDWTWVDSHPRRYDLSLDAGEGLCTVTFYVQNGNSFDDSAWKVYQTINVPEGSALGTDMPALPTQEDPDAHWMAWEIGSHNGDGRELHADTVITDDISVYARKTLPSSGGGEIRVMGPKADFISILKEKFNATSIDITGISAYGGGKETNPNYDPIAGPVVGDEANGWKNGDAYYRVMNRHLPGSEDYNTTNNRVKPGELEGIKVYAYIDGSSTTEVLTLNRNDLDVRIESNEVFEIYLREATEPETPVDPDPQPDPDPATNPDVSSVSVVVDCTTNDEHDKTVSIIEDSYTFNKAWDGEQWTCTVEISPEKYVDDTHTLNPESQTGELLYVYADNNWQYVGDDTPTVTFTVECETTEPGTVAKLNVDKTVAIPDGKSTAAVGDMLEYTVTITNNSDVAAKDVIVTDTMWESGSSVMIGGKDGQPRSVTAGVDGYYVTVNVPADGSVVIYYTYIVPETDAGKTLYNTVTAGTASAMTSTSVEEAEEPEPEPEEPNVYDIYVTVHNGTATFYGSKVTSSIRAAEGEDITITFTPDEGYTLDYATIDDGMLLIPDGGVYTLKQVDSDHTIEVFYESDKIGGGDDGNEPDGTPDYRQVFVKYVAADGNGSVAPSFDTFNLEVDETGKVMANVALSLEGVATPNADATFAYWTIDGLGFDGGAYSYEADLSGKGFTGYVAGETYTFTAYFNVKPEQVEYDINVEVVNGTAEFEGTNIGANSVINVYPIEDDNKNVTITFVPEDGFVFDAAYVGNEPVDLKDNSYTFGEVTADVTIKVLFKQDSVPITPVTPMPTPGEIRDLIKDKVVVDCVNDEMNHGDKAYGLLDDALVRIEKTDDTTVKVTLDATVYQARYNTDTETKHSLADGQSSTVTFALSYIDEVWQAVTNDLPITIEVICDTVPVEPDPSVTGFTKTLVTDRDLYNARGIAYPDFYRGTVIVDEGDRVTLIYNITVKGTAGTEFTVRDDSADFAQTGVIPSSGETSFYVAKTFSWRDVRNAGDTLDNTASVSVDGETVKTDTERVPVDIDWDINVPDIDDDDDDDDTVYIPNWLNTTDHYAYIVGYEDGTIRPQNNITRAEVATIFFRLLTDNARERYWSTTNDFSDVAAESWYNNAISTLSNMGIINGYEDGTFKPNAPITRAEFTAIATRFFDYEAEYDGAFNDVSARAWYADYVQAAVDMGLVDGYPDGGFHPDAYITRAEACTIVNRVLHRVPHEDHLLAESVMNTWPDNPKSAWYYEDMQEATNSHDYDWIRDDGETVEDWTKKLPERDWSALETEWATAYSR